MHFHVVTLFPEAFDSYLKESIIGRAITEKKISVSFVNPRLFVTGKKYKRVWPDGNVSQIVDDRPYGGGPGMIIRAEPVLAAVESISKKIARRKNAKVKIINFAPGGKKFTTSYAKAAAKKYTDIIFLCGRYEGIDARVTKILKAEEISIGDYVLTGGELPAMVLIDSMARQIPGVLGKFESLEEERISSGEFYTRPEILEHKGKKYRVPKVLLSGDHKKIEEWKKGK
ncbi:MAG: tRNA (guanosine(37)-N1)-methyltransferase TrmD [Candidatus Pacebacteria bacterium]|nr:tRNA (guanosine(37)-N1)-methyltransferase TrmD [Candidatus Paceibacterota bacterium]